MQYHIYGLLILKMFTLVVEYSYWIKAKLTEYRSYQSWMKWSPHFHCASLRNSAHLSSDALLINTIVPNESSVLLLDIPTTQLLPIFSLPSTAKISVCDVTEIVPKIGRKKGQLVRFAKTKWDNPMLSLNSLIPLLFLYRGDESCVAWFLVRHTYVSDVHHLYELEITLESESRQQGGVDRFAAAWGSFSSEALASLRSSF